MANIIASHAIARGSIPRVGRVVFVYGYRFYLVEVQLNAARTFWRPEIEFVDFNSYG